MTSAYERRPVQTMGVGVKKLSREGKGREGSPRHIRCVSFWRKHDQQGKQRSCSSKNLDWNFSCSAWDKIFGNNFLSFTFAWSRFWLRFWSHSRDNPPTPPPALGQNFDRWIRAWQLIHLPGNLFSFQSTFKAARYSFSASIPPTFEHKLRHHKQRFGKIATTVVSDKDKNLLWSELQWH